MLCILFCISPFSSYCAAMYFQTTLRNSNRPISQGCTIQIKLQKRFSISTMQKDLHKSKPRIIRSKWMQSTDSSLAGTTVRHKANSIWVGCGTKLLYWCFSWDPCWGTGRKLQSFVSLRQTRGNIARKARCLHSLAILSLLLDCNTLYFPLKVRRTLGGQWFILICGEKRTKV